MITEHETRDPVFNSFNKSFNKKLVYPIPSYFNKQYIFGMHIWKRNIAALFLVFYLPVAIGSTFLHTHGAIQIHSDTLHAVDNAESVFNHADDHCITCKILSSSFIHATGHLFTNASSTDTAIALVREAFVDNTARLFSNRAPPFIS